MKRNKIYIIATVFLLAGLTTFLIGFANLNFDIRRLTTEEEFAEKAYTSSQPIQSIKIEDQDTDIHISASADEKVHITYYENDKLSYEISESKEGNLAISKKDDHAWYDYVFHMQFFQPKLLIQIPESFSGDLSINIGDGKILLKDIKAAQLQLTTSNGKIQVEDVSVSGNIAARTSDAEISFTRTDAEGEIECKTSCGKIELQNVVGKDIWVETADSKITLNSIQAQKAITAKNSCGSIQLEGVEFGSELNCKTSDGSIKGSISGNMGDYSIVSRVADGNNNLPENQVGGEKKVSVQTSCGNIEVYFMG